MKLFSIVIIKSLGGLKCHRNVLSHRISLKIKWSHLIISSVIQFVKSLQQLTYTKLCNNQFFFLSFHLIALMTKEISLILCLYRIKALLMLSTNFSNQYRMDTVDYVYVLILNVIYIFDPSYCYLLVLFFYFFG